MSSEMVGLLGVFLLLVLMLGGMRIGYASLLLAFGGMVLLKGWGTGVSMVGIVPYSQLDNWTYAVIPMFVLMGFFVSHAGLADEIFSAAEKWFGHLPGGLTLAAVFGSAGFAACTGSTAAADAVAGKILIPRMREIGYSARLATGTIAASGTLAILIPPSATVVLYGILTEQSIGALLIAGIIPGILSAGIYAAMLWVRCSRNPSLAPALPAVSRRERVASLKGIWVVFFILAIMLGGLYFGVFTPSEAGAVGAFGTFLFALARKRVSWRMLKASVWETVQINAMIFVLMIGIMTFMTFMSLSGGTNAIIEFIATSAMSPWMVMALIIVLYIVLGAFLGTYAMLILTLPVLFPLVVSLGFNPIWFGIIVIKLCEFGSITPPIGYSVFVVNSIARDVPVHDIFRGCVPFMAMDLLTIAILIAFPQIVTFLPSTMKMT